MPDGNNPLPPVFPFNAEKFEAWKKEEERRKQEAAASRAVVAQNIRVMLKNHLLTFDVKKPAYQLAKVLPTDVALLSEVVNDKTQSIERRAKILEVLILRGANDGYEASNYYLVHTLKSYSFPIPEIQQLVDCQKASLDLVMKNEPALFAQLSRSTDLLPQAESARFPATEWMYTHLREGGLLAADETRKEKFLPWLEGLPPRDRGRAMFHLADAADPTGTQVKLSPYVEVGVGPVTAGVNYTGSDGDWRATINAANGKIEEGLGYNVETGPDPAKKDDRQEYYEGYRLASRATPASGNER